MGGAPWYCRVRKGTGSQVDVIMNKELRAESRFYGSVKLLWKLLVSAPQGYGVLLPYLYSWLCCWGYLGMLKYGVILVYRYSRMDCFTLVEARLHNWPTRMWPTYRGQRKRIIALQNSHSKSDLSWQNKTRYWSVKNFGSQKNKSCSGSGCFIAYPFASYHGPPTLERGLIQITAFVCRITF